MKGEVPKMGLKMITSNNYEDNVVLSVEPVVINLWAKWSPLCDKVGDYPSGGHRQSEPQPVQ